MIGIVLVSHSAALAQGVIELVQQMVGDRVPLAAAGGTNLVEAPIGTDPVKVLAAIEAVYSTDGVLVLMDLGSAIMSAEAALEFLEPAQQQNIYLCEASLVEGAVAAAVRALAGGTMEQVFAEARGALAAKLEQLAPLLRLAPTPGVTSATVDLTPSFPTGDFHTRSLVVLNRLGLHARPAARLVSLAGQFDAQITITVAGRTVPATSMNQVATLGARQGDLLIVRAGGSDASAALTAIEELAIDHFGDPLDSVQPAPEAVPVVADNDDEAAGIPASGGVAIGPVMIYRPAFTEVIAMMVTDVTGEQERLQTAIAAVITQLHELRAEMARRVGAGEASIFDAHLLMLQDIDLQPAATQEIETRRVNAEAAWQATIQAVAARYRAMEDPYLARRADDVLDVGQRVLRQLLGKSADLPSLASVEPCILVAHDLKPSDVARLPSDVVLGIITERGGANGHSAILARALGIPAVSGVGALVSHISDGQVIALDGDSGRVWLAPEAELLETLRRRQSAWLAERSAARRKARQPAVMRDGRHMEVIANIAAPADVDEALAAGAEGVGIFRSEFLFMDRPSPPSEEEQLAAYVDAAHRLGGRPLVVRTLDAGGDKPLAYLPSDLEPNPFLGKRGLRYSLEHPGIFKSQLRAILRTAAAYPVKMMLPMLSTLDEWIQADALLDEACAELQEAGLPFDDDMAVGIMVEVPAAVFSADKLARFVDFFSIGSNDLTQYVMAADRGNASVAALIHPYQPALLQSMRQVVQAGHAAGIRVGICGELAGDPRATALLVGLGFDDLSMSAPSIPQVKARLRTFDMAQAQAVAAMVLGMNTASEIEEYLAAESERVKGMSDIFLP